MKKHDARTTYPMPLLLAAMLAALVAGCTDGALSVEGNYVDGRTGDFYNGGRSVGGRPDGPGAPGRVVAGGASIEVSSPLPGTIVTTPAIVVKGVAVNVDSVVINGTSVQVVEGAFQSSFPATGEGPLDISIASEKLPTLVVPVVVDLKPPVLRVDSPARGAFMVMGQQDRITVKGAATDAATQVKEVKVNGQIVTLAPNGSFSVELTPAVGTNFVQVDAVDGAGKTASTVRAAVYGQFHEWDRPTDDAISLRLRADAMGVIEEGLVNSLGGDLLSNVDLGGGGGDFEVRGISYGQISLDLIPQNGYFDTTIRIHDMVIEIATEQRVFFFDVTITGDISADPAELRGKLYLRADGAGGVSMDLTDVSVQLHNFDLNLDGLVGIIDGLIEGMVEELATNMLLEVLNSGGLGGLLGGSGQPTLVDLLGQQAELQLYITELGIDPGGMTFVADGGLNFSPSPLAPPSPGTLKTANPPPPGNSDGGRMVRMSLADDFVNQILGGVWRSGALNIDLGAALAGGDGGLPLQLNAGTFSLLVGNDLLTYADGRETPVGLVMRPLLPPVARIQDGDQIMNVTVGDMMLDFSLERADGASVKWASVAIQLAIDIKIGLKPDGELDLQTDMTVKVDLAEEPLFDIDDAALEQIIATMFSGLADDLGEGGGIGGLLGGGGGGLFGDTPGIGIGQMDVRADGQARDFMSFYVDLLLE